MFDEIFGHVTDFESNQRGLHILSSWMVHTGCVFVAGIYPSRTWILRAFWVHAVEYICAQTRSQFILSSERVLENGVRTHINSKGKIPSTERLQRGLNLWYCIMQDSKSSSLPADLFHPPEYETKGEAGGSGYASFSKAYNVTLG